MRIDSVAVSTGHRGRFSQKEPRVGTRLRELYDLFKANKGIVIPFPISHQYSWAEIEQLRNFYGLDILNLNGDNQPGRKKGGSRWVLAGEWFGREYVDYISKNKRKLAKVVKDITVA